MGRTLDHCIYTVMHVYVHVPKHPLHIMYIHTCVCVCWLLSAAKLMQPIKFSLHTFTRSSPTEAKLSTEVPRTRGVSWRKYTICLAGQHIRRENLSGGGEPTGIGSYLAVVHSKPNMPHLPYGGKGTVPRLPHRSLSAENPQGKANREIARSPGKGRHNIS